MAKPQEIRRPSPIDSAAWAAWQRRQNWYAGMSCKDIFKHAFRTGWQAAKRARRTQRKGG